MAASPQLLADIGIGDSSDPAPFVDIGGIAYFGAIEGSTGRELWKSDGTLEGTQLVKDIAPGMAGSDLRQLTKVGETAFFIANDGTTGAELWKTDGTSAGTTLVKDIGPGTERAIPDFAMANVNGTLFFLASDGFTGGELWKSDGTAAGTVLVKDIRLGSGGSSPLDLINVGGVLYFTADEGVDGRKLWKSDGTVAGTVRVSNAGIGTGSGSPKYLVAANGMLFFTAGSNQGVELWKSDGTDAGTVLVKNVDGTLGSSSPRSLTNVNGTLFFSAYTEANGRELWSSDGTSAGTVLVKDVFPGMGDNGLGQIVAHSSDPKYLTNVAGTLYFSAVDDVAGTELWKSDGTSAGTVLVRDVFPGDTAGYLNDSLPSRLQNLDGTLYFVARTGAAHFELFKSDGTESGTNSVASHSSWNDWHEAPLAVAAVNGRVYFRARGGVDGADGRELWAIDQLSDETHFININPATTTGSSPARFAELDGITLFEAKSYVHGQELWKTDGTPGGTSFFKDINAGPNNASSQLTRSGDSLFFVDGGGFELWKTDGTLAGTSLVKAAVAYPANGLGSLIDVEGTLFFTLGMELWKTDGTAAGTVLVTDQFDLLGGSASAFIAQAGLLYFAADDGVHGRELWQSDGTESGTVMVVDINPGPLGSQPSWFVALGDALLFTANDGSNGYELWKSDGTGGGTVLVKDILPGLSPNSYPGSGPPPLSSSPQRLTRVGDRVLFAAEIPDSGRELLITDGTTAGTVLVKDFSPGLLTAASPRNLVEVGGLLFFNVHVSGIGDELWKSDGTPEGTVLVRDIVPGSGAAAPDRLTNVAGTLYFVANDGASGRELWKSDGTSEGTVLVSDLRPGSISSYPDKLTNIGGALYFAANDGVSGLEPWIIPVATEVSVVGRQLFYNNSKFDGGSAANTADDNAIASDKIAHLLGAGLATTASVSSYSRGINGVMIDIANAEDAVLTVDDFTFRVGTSNSPEGWALASAPLEVVVRAGAGIGGSDRVTITWADGAIKNTWLQVVVEGNDAAGGFNTNTGLAESDVFYFGSRVGDAFVGGSLAAAVTSAADELAARFNQGVNQPVTSLYDFNRDGVVSAADQLITRSNVGLLLMLDIDESVEALVAQAAAAPPIKKATGSPADAHAALAFALAAGELDGESADDVDDWWRHPRRLA